MNAISKTIEEGLKPQHQVFADAYLQTSHVEKSALAAGAPIKSARNWGTRVLQNRVVKQYIAAKQNLQAKKAESLEAKLIAEMEALAFSNIGDLVTIDDEGLPQIDFSRATRAQLAAVNSVSTKKTKRYDGKGQHIATEVNAKFGLSSKQEAIRTLMQFKGMLRPEEHKVTLDVSERLLRARGRLFNDSDETLDGEVLSVSDARTGEKPGGGGTGV